MQLICLRHGEAEVTANDGTDKSRQLTSNGIKKATQACDGLVRVISKLDDLNSKIDFLVSSPYKRAIQTRDILKGSLNGSPVSVQEEVIFEHAHPDGDPELFQAWLKKICDKSSQATVLLVSHQPFISRLSGLLTTGKSCDLIKLGLAGAFCLECKGSQWMVRWVLRPKILRML